MKRLAILGASGHGKVLADIAEACGWDEIVFFDDEWPAVSSNGHWVVSGDGERLLENVKHYAGVIVAIGNNAVRHEKHNWLLTKGAPMASLVHPTAVVSCYAEIGVGSVVMPGVVVNVAARIGDGAILNTGCSVDHDCIIGDFTHISPGARLAGGVSVGSQSWIGIGASVKQCINIGQNVVVGAGAVVVSDIPNGSTAMGVPAIPV